MSSIGFPDGQRITQWLGAPLVESAGLAIGNVAHIDGPFSLASWASVVVAIKPTGGSVTVTVKQQISGGPPGLELDETFIVAAGATAFEAVVLFGDAVTLTLLGSAPGVTVDYALYPSNSTTNAQVLTQATIDVQHNDALVDAEAAIDFLDLANGILFAVVADGANGRVKITPVLGNPFKAPGNVFANAGAAGEMSLQSNHALYFDNTSLHYLYAAAPGQLATNDRLTVAGVDVHRSVRLTQSHIEGGFVSVAPGAPGVSFGFALAFAAAPTMVCASVNNAVPVAVFSTSATGGSLYHASGATVSAYWLAEGQG